jgi:hypothetical protein
VIVFVLDVAITEIDFGVVVFVEIAIDDDDDDETDV